MESNTANQDQDANSTFEPLPSGSQPDQLSPERFRELLGWSMTQQSAR
jgi:hypothetical protein